MTTQSLLKSRVHYNSETGVFTWISAGKHQQRIIGKPAGALCSDGYLVFKIDGKLLKAHRMAWLYMTGDLPSCNIDHINRIRSDNRFHNLRLASGLENHHNKSAQKNNTSGCTGVYWQKKANKWRAAIWLNGKDVHLGMYSSFEEACAARASAKPIFHPTSPEAITS